MSCALQNVHTVNPMIKKKLGCSHHSCIFELNFMVLQIKTEGRDKFPINIPQIYVNFMKDERFPFVC